VLRNTKLQTILPAVCLPPADAHVTGRFTAVSQWLLRNSTGMLYCGLGLFAGLIGYALIRSPLGLAWENLPAGIAFLAFWPRWALSGQKRRSNAKPSNETWTTSSPRYFKSVNNLKRAAILRLDFKDPRAAEFVLTLGFWGFLQAMALAYGRAYLGNSSRYLDTLSTLPIASLASLFVLGEGADYRRFPRRLVVMLAVIWVAVLFWGVWRISRTAMEDYKTLANYLQWSKRWSLVEEENVRAFVATNDRRYLPEQPLWAIPYSSADRLAELLRDPNLSAILPSLCRPPLELEKDEKSDASFVPEGCPPDQPKRAFTRVWGSYSANGANQTGAFVSQPLSAALPKLVIPVGCGTSLEGIRLQLVEQQTGRRTELNPKARGRWQTIIVTAPANPFRLEITNQNPNSWVAVGDLSEMGRLSYAALLLLDHAAGILVVGLCLCVWLTGLAVVRRGIGIPGGHRLWPMSVRK
jgi:hypothetical protein